MKLKFLVFLAFFFYLRSYSQDVLFTIDDKPYYTSEFIRIYEKNKDVIQDSKENSIEKQLELFVNYKLKVQSAKDLGLDTVEKYKTELKLYRNSLVLPYLKDEAVTNKLVKEAYDRLNKEVNVSHILIFVKENALPVDTLAAYDKLIEARNLILNGEDFAEVSKKYSQDQSVNQNGGDIGYFTALQMVYPFESAAYNTLKGEISMPFRTKFGFHILKVNDIRVSQGEVEVAHIMIKKKSIDSKKKIDSIYKLIIANPSEFESLAVKLSEDNASAPAGGKLKKFSSGQMITSFSDEAFLLQKEGDFSNPFETQYGWHIVKLINKYPIESFDLLEDKLTRQVESDDRSNLIGKSIVDKLLKEYNVVVYNDALNQFNSDNWRENSEKFQQKLMSVQNQDIYQDKFIQFLKTVKNVSINSAFNTFKENEVLNYYKSNIELTNPEFAATYKEFEEGLLLFEMLEKEVWEKSKDSIGLKSYYELNKADKYKNTGFEDDKGIIISDYQNSLEKMWIKELYQKYNVKFNENQKKHILEAKLN